MSGVIKHAITLLPSLALLRLLNTSASLDLVALEQVCGFAGKNSYSLVPLHVAVELWSSGSDQRAERCIGTYRNSFLVLPLRQLYK